jgi:hypothetical protein
MCADGWSSEDEEVNGVCPDCGAETVDGFAREGCNYGRDPCPACGDAPCDQSC